MYARDQQHMNGTFTWDQHIHTAFNTYNIVSMCHIHTHTYIHTYTTHGLFNQSSGSIYSTQS